MTKEFLLNKLLAIFFLFILCETHAQKNSKAATSDHNHFEEELNKIEKLYEQRQEKNAITIIDSLIDNNLYNSPQEHEALLRWKVTSHYKLKETKEAYEVLAQLFEQNDDLDYEKFYDKGKHFLNFFTTVYQESDKDFVFVNKVKENLDAAPAVITVYKKEDIEKLGARNLIDLILLTPGFAEIGDNNERNIGIRGAFGTTVQNILFLINGHRLNDLLTSSSAPDWISLDYVEQVELMRGPGSALYGGNAFSGVINIITKSGKNFQGSQLNATIGSAQLFESNTSSSDHIYKLHYEYGDRLKNRDKLYLSATVFASGGSRHDYENNDLNTRYPHLYPDFHSGDTLLSQTPGTEYINRYLPGYNVLFQFNSKSIDVTVNAQSNNLVIHRPNSSNLWNESELDVYRTRKRSDSREFIQVKANLKEPKGSKGGWLDAKLSFDHFHKDFYSHSHSNFNNNVLDTSLVRLKGDEYRFTGGLEYSTQNLSFLKGKKSNTIMGLQGSITDWHYSAMLALTDPTDFSFDPAVNFFSDNEKGKTENIAAFFFQSSQHIINNRLIATLGFRLNYHPEYSDFSSFRYGDEISPRISLVYLSKKKENETTPLKVKLLYNSAFLPPAFLYRKGGVTGFKGAKNLNSQKIESVEFNISGDISQKFKYFVDYYVNKIDNFIQRDNDLYANQKDLRRFAGWEIGFEYKSKVWVKGLSNKTFINLSTTSKSVNETASASIFKALFKSGFENEDLDYYPSYTIYGGSELSFSLPGENERRIFGGLSFNMYGKTTVLGSVVYDTDNAAWLTGQSEQYELKGSFNTPIFHLNTQYNSGLFSIALSVHNLFNTNNEIPSLVSKSGRMRGENQEIRLKIGYKFK